MVDRHTASTLKTIEEYFGASTHTLLRVCQVTNSSLLPPVYQTMADYRKKERENHHATGHRRYDEPDGTVSTTFRRNCRPRE
jgi:hypothetical protein